jgi:hypothetical protein
MVVTATADVDLAVSAALLSGFGTAGQRCTSLGTVVVHADIAEEFTQRLDKAVRDAPVGDPSSAVVYGPMLSQRFAEQFEEYLTWIQPHHRVLGSAGTGRITGQNPRPGFVGDAETGLYYHPVVVVGVREDEPLFREETFGPIIGLATYRDLDEAIRLAKRARLRPVVVDLHARPSGGVPVRPRHLRWHGQREQLHVRRRGTSAVRRQRQVRQRITAIRHVGARPVRPMAVNELGLLGHAAEGADRHHRTHPGRVVPAS